ncbi:MAG: hypothetical protein AAF639_25745 [Chloroflexota bacterium]
MLDDDDQGELDRLMDAYADGSLIPISILQKIHARKSNSGWTRTISGQRYMITFYGVTIHIGSHTIHNINVAANENTDEVIIGRDVLNRFVVTLDGLGEVTEVRC